MSAALRGLAAILLFEASAFCQTAGVPGNCTPAHLKTTAKGIDGGLGHVAYALEVTNTSVTACRLEDAPEIQIRSGRSTLQKIEVCANCGAYLFLQQPSKSVILHKDESAYILLGFARGSTETCLQTDVVQLHLTGGRGALEFRKLAEI